MRQRTQKRQVASGGCSCNQMIFLVAVISLNEAAYLAYSMHHHSASPARLNLSVCLHRAFFRRTIVHHTSSASFSRRRSSPPSTIMWMTSPLAVAFAPTVVLPSARADGARRPLSRRPSAPPPSTPPAASSFPTRLQQARLRLHLLHLQRQQRRDNASSTEMSSSPKNSSSNTPRSAGAAARPPARAYSLTPEERRARSERMRARWSDPEWRAAMLARRRSRDAIRAKSEVAKQLWRDESFRARQREARLGRPAPNKGVSPSRATRLRMSVARKGMVMSEETRRRMSVAKRERPLGDDWPRLISESKKGKTRQYFAMRREFRALHRDLKLWSDSYKSMHGKLPKASSFDKFVAPMMVFRIRRYLTLREAIGADEVEASPEIISKD